MSRLLFWLALAVLVVYAIRSKTRQAPPPRASARPKPERVTEAEAMSCCAHCGMYFPASEAVRADGLDYCSPAHVRLPAK
jgi:uncharacterized protein